MDIQVPPPSTSPPVVPSPQFSKLPLIIGTILLITLVGVGSYVLGIKKGVNDQMATDVGKTLPPPVPSPTPDETTSWKTFSNADYSFRYPPTWSIESSDYLNSTHIRNPNKTIAVSITKGQWPFGFGGPESNTITQDLEIAFDGKQYAVKEITVGERDKFINFDPKSPKKYQILIGTITAKVEAKTIGKTSIEEYNDSKDTILKILSTFKFTDQNQPADALSIKTYTNTSFGFSFSYPSDWQIKEQSNSIQVSNSSNETLTIGYKRKGEGIGIVRSGVGAGDIINRGSIAFGNKTVAKNVLAYQNQDKSVLYDNGGEIPVNNLVFSLGVDNYSNQSSYPSIDIKTEEQVDKILSTFKFTQ